MSTKAQSTGMQGVFLVAAELARLGLTVSTTSRNAMGADLLVTDAACRMAFSVQVKTNATPRAHWLVGAKAKELRAPSHVYVLVNLKAKRAQEHEYYIVPSKALARLATKKVRPNSEWHAVHRDQIKAFREKWEHLGCAPARPIDDAR